MSCPGGECSRRNLPGAKIGVVKISGGEVDCGLHFAGWCAT